MVEKRHGSSNKAFFYFLDLSFSSFNIYQLGKIWLRTSPTCPYFWNEFSFTQTKPITCQRCVCSAKWCSICCININIFIYLFINFIEAAAWRRRKTGMVGAPTTGCCPFSKKENILLQLGHTWLHSGCLHQQSRKFIRTWISFWESFKICSLAVVMCYARRW